MSDPSSFQSAGNDYAGHSSTMPRLHLKRVVAASVAFLVCLLTAFLWHHKRSRPYYRGVPDVDPDLWRLLGSPETSVKSVVPRPVPMVHVKQLPPLSLNISWSMERVEDTFFRYLENKDVRCEKDVRVGNWNEGGWNVCLSPPFTLHQPCVVFSFGIGNDWQFDDSVSNTYGCRVLAFDPSMIEQQAPRSSLIDFRRIGLGAINGVGRNGWELKTLEQHFRDEGFWGVPIDYVKIDVEYMEWEILKQVVTGGSLRLVKQLGFEMHTPELFRISKKINETVQRDMWAEKLDFVHMFESLRQVEILGFRKFNYRKNPFGSYDSVYTSQARSCCYELHYINLDFLWKNSTLVHYKDSKLFHR